MHISKPLTVYTYIPQVSNLRPGDQNWAARGSDPAHGVRMRNEKILTVDGVKIFSAQVPHSDYYGLEWVRPVTC